MAKDLTERQALYERINEEADRMMSGLRSSGESGDPERLIEEARQFDPNDLILQAPGLVALGRSRTYSGDHSGAAQVLLQVIDAYEGLPADRWILSAHYLLGLAYHHLAFYSDALSCHQKQYELAEAIADNDMKASALRRMGVTHYEMGRFERAMAYYQQALDTYAEIDSHGGMAGCYNNMSMLFSKMAQHEEAINYALQALPGFEADGHLTGLITANITISEAYLAAGRLDEALAYAQKAVELGQDGAGLNQLVAARMQLAAVFKALGRYDEALGTLLELEPLLGEADNNFFRVEIYKRMSEVYEVLGNSDKALAYFKRMYTEERALNSASAQARFAYLETIFQTRQALREADIQRQRAEESERRAERDRQYFMQLSRMKDEYMYAATHDLKNPLATIRLNTAILRAKTESDLISFIDQIETQTLRMNTLIAEILDLAKLETGQALRFAKASLKSVVAQAVDEYEDRAKQKGLDFVVEFPKDTRLELVMDEYYMYRALSNLLSNAIKYTPSGGQVRLRVKRLADAMIRIEVEDTGLGVDHAHLPRIFDRFYRVETEATAGISGTGLGLAIVKSVIEQHSGRIDVDSQAGVGSRFLILLPINIEREGSALVMD